MSEVEEKEFGVKPSKPTKTGLRSDLVMSNGRDLYSIAWVDGLKLRDPEVKDAMRSIINNQESLYLELGRKYTLGGLSGMLCAILWRMAHTGSNRIGMSIRDVEKWCGVSKATASDMRKDVMKLLGANRRHTATKSFVQRKFFHASTADRYIIRGLEGSGSRFNALYRKGILAHRNAMWFGDFNLDDRFHLSVMEQGVNLVHFLRECGFSDASAYRKQQKARKFSNEYLYYLESGDDTQLMLWMKHGLDKGGKKFERIFRELCEFRGWDAKKGVWKHEFEETDECFLSETFRLRKEEHRRKNRAFLASRRKKYKAREKQEHDMWNHILWCFNRGMPKAPRKATKETWLYMYMINNPVVEVAEVTALAVSIRNGLFADGIYDTPGRVIAQAAVDIHAIEKNDVDDILDVMGWDEMHYSPSHLVELMNSLP